MKAEMARIRIRTLVVGPVGCNCSIVACSTTGEAAVIDPGGDAEEILAEVAAMGVTVKWLLHTHAHYDHVLATGAVAAATSAAILVPAADRALYENLPAQGWIFGFSAVRPPEPTRWLAGGETLSIGNLSVQVIPTPGHTPGSVSYYFGPAMALIFSGDTLFADSVGRTDLPGGSFEQLQDSIRNKLYVLPKETRVIPGHGPETTIGHEREHNPFISTYPGE
jgi:hydroxyacylglutathione hydrolase